jgi:hypothetical protein
LRYFIFFFFIVAQSYFYAGYDRIQPKKESQKSSKQEIQESILTIYECIDQGNLNIAYCLIQKCLKLKGLEKEDRYLLLKYLSKIHFLQEDMMHFNQVCYEAWKLRRNDGDIYKALYFSEKVNYWHYYYVSDSTVKYARSAMSLLKKNWKFKDKIPYYVIYQSYGTSFLHNCGIEIKPSMSKTEIGISVQRKINCFYDSSLYHFKRTKFTFNLDKAILYRSKGNRLLDVLGYHFKTKKEFNSYSPSSDSIKRVVLSYYDSSLKQLHPKNVDFKSSILNLKALTFYISGDLKNGNAIINRIYGNYHRKYGSLSNIPNINNILTTVSYKMKANITLNAKIYASHCAKEERILSKLLAVWKGWLDYERNNIYDIYHNSPFQNLSFLLLNKYKFFNKVSILEKSFSLALTDFSLAALIEKNKTFQNLRLQRAKLEFKAINSDKFRQKISRIIHFSTENQIAFKKYQMLKIDEIQNKLSRGEAFLFHLKGSLLPKDKQFLITKDSLIVFDVNFQPASLEYISTIGFPEFKRVAFNLYENYFKSVKRVFPNLNRIYVGSKNVDDFSWFISDTSGQNYNELKYLGRRINFINVYNPIEYFNSSKQFLERKVTVFKTNSEKSQEFRNLNTLFKTNESALFTYSKKYADLINPTNSGDNVHFVGHGILKQNKYLPLNSNSNKIPIKSGGDLMSRLKRIKRFNNKLLIFSNCYSGKNNYGVKYYDLNTFNHLLAAGVKSVIVSDGLAEDESSAYLFKEFYRNLSKGKTIENALFDAKKSFLRNHNGSRCNPIYWANYKLITNHKDMRIKVENNFNLILFGTYLIGFILIISGLIYFKKN